MGSDGGSGEVFNIGTGKKITIDRLWETVSGIAGVAITPEKSQGRPGDVRHSVAAIGRASKTFGYSPETTLEEGLRRTFDWYRENAS